MSRMRQEILAKKGAAKEIKDRPQKHLRSNFLWFEFRERVQERRGVGITDLVGDLAPAKTRVAKQARVAKTQRFEIGVRGRFHDLCEAANERVLVHMAVFGDLCDGDGSSHSCVQDHQDFAHDLVAKDQGFVGVCDKLGQIEK